MRKLTWSEWVLLAEAFEQAQEFEQWRTGQKLFNALHATVPDVAEEIRAGNLDPFHRDDRIPQLLELLAPVGEPFGDSFKELVSSSVRKLQVADIYNNTVLSYNEAMAKKLGRAKPKPLLKKTRKSWRAA